MQNQNKVPRKSSLSDDTIASLVELGEVLREIHEKLIAQGYTYREGKFYEPGEIEKEP